ncbi:MAG: tryptophan synthase subunit alpha, partial [Lancefieldella rimae]|nr:tryptophan synthase subunit alpha [Lancefieldella rimae]
TAKRAYEELSKIRKVFSSRIVLMTYEEGLKKYEIQKLPRWIYDALLCVDGVQRREDYAGLVHIFSQSLSGEEIRQAVEESDLFAYVVSGEGKTGGTISGHSGYVETIARIRAYSAIPAYVGFGIKSAQDVAEVLGNGADGAIIGSELIRKVNSGDLRLVEQYLKSLCQKV